jgi:hypothetical protein
MFEAALLVCLAAAPASCVELTDTRGPYETEKACEVRVDEMAEFTTENHLFNLNISWKCSKAEGLKT